MKPGWTTTEFWLQFIPHVFTMLVFLGFVKPEDATSLQGHMNDAITKAVAVGGSVLAIWKYIQSRIEVKKAALAAAAASPAIAEEVIPKT